ncbi:MAG: LysR family transcriptional regulator [Planctomycetales bacterium]|nr:LysR family transcriptional regulator [Planctomycetales bacterium]
MHIKTLKVFCDVVRLRSFSQAADEHGITQPGASQAVLHLEEDLGVKLIDRSKRPWVLTEEGDVYYQGVRKLLRQFESLEDRVRRSAREEKERVRVASIYSVGLSHMNAFVRDFMEKYPQANVQIQYQHPDQVYELVEREAVDFGLVSYAKETKSVQAIPWREEPMVLVCAPGHPFVHHETIELELLDGTRLVGFDRGLKIRSAIDRVLHAHDISVEVVLEFDNIETIKRAIEIDAGVGLLPAPTVDREVQLGSLVARPIAPRPAGPDLVRPLAIILNRNAAPSGVAEKFLEEIRGFPLDRAADTDSPGHSSGHSPTSMLDSCPPTNSSTA